MSPNLEARTWRKCLLCKGKVAMCCMLLPGYWTNITWRLRGLKRGSPDACVRGLTPKVSGTGVRSTEGTNTCWQVLVSA